MSLALLIVAIALYVAGSLFYARIVLSDAPAARRFAFTLSLLLVVGIAVSAFDARPEIALPFAAYVAATLYGWSATIRDALKRGAEARGIAMIATSKARSTARGGSA